MSDKIKIPGAGEFPASDRGRFAWNDADVLFKDEKGKIISPEQVAAMQAEARAAETAAAKSKK